MRNSADVLRPVTALDDLYAEGRCVPSDPPDREPRPPRAMRCRDCGVVGGHPPPLCPGNGD